MNPIVSRQEIASKMAAPESHTPSSTAPAENQTATGATLEDLLGDLVSALRGNPEWITANAVGKPNVFEIMKNEDQGTGGAQQSSEVESECKASGSS